MPVQETAEPYTLKVPLAENLQKLPTYVFAELDEMKAKARARGVDLIDLGIGNPDVPTPEPIRKAIQEAAGKPENYHYPPFKGKQSFREAVANWMQKRYGVDINPETEVQALIGSKEGLGHLSFAYLNPGDVSLVPSPYYPVHSRATWLAGGVVHHLPLKEENNFLPDLDSIPADVLKKAKLLFLNFPNNPTAACADLDFYTKAVAFAKQHNLVLISDLAYSEICFDGYHPPSIFQVPGAKDVAIEFHSFSKSFSMAGCRVGFACGNAQIIKALYSRKTNLDYGVSGILQDRATYALTQGEQFLPEIIKVYQERRDVVVEGMNSLGWNIPKPKATMYVWLPVPERFKTSNAESKSKAFCQHLMDETGVVITPGVAFGDEGDQYFRISLVAPKEVLAQAIERMREKGIRYA